MSVDPGYRNHGKSMGIDSIGFGVRIHGMSMKVNPPVPIGPGLEHPRTTSAEAGSLPGAGSFPR